MTATASLDAELAVRSFRAIGTTATVVVQDPTQAAVAMSKIRERFILALNWKSKLSRRFSPSRN